MKNKKDKENKEPSKRTVGRPPFVPTDEDRAVVKLLVACGMSQDRVCLRIRGNDGKPICEATLKRHFAHELLAGKAEVEAIVLTQFMAAIKRGARWAICKYMDARMWRPESGGWRARPYEVAVGGAHSAASGDSARARRSKGGSARREAAHIAILYAFDLIEHDGEDLRNRPFLDRKDALARLVARYHGGHLVQRTRSRGWPYRFRSWG